MGIDQNFVPEMPKNENVTKMTNVGRSSQKESKLAENGDSKQAEQPEIAQKKNPAWQSS